MMPLEGASVRLDLHDLTPATQAALAKIVNPNLPKILAIQGGIIRSVHDFMSSRGVFQVQPLLLSPTSYYSKPDTADPRVVDGRVVKERIKYGRQSFSLMKSKNKIVHKQLVLANDQL